MTTVDTLCRQGGGAARSADETKDQARSQVAERLRCASKLGCNDAVRCSDDAIVTLRDLLGKTQKR